MKVAIRAATPADYGFIVHSGMREIGDTVLSKRDLERLAPIFRPLMDAVVRGATSVAVACDAADPDTLVGWAAANQNTVLYVYVSFAVRGNGAIADRLSEFVAPQEEQCAS